MQYRLGVQHLSSWLMLVEYLKSSYAFFKFDSGVIDVTKLIREELLYP